jgi:hypothetical protein
MNATMFPTDWSQSRRGISTTGAVVLAGANTETAMVAVGILGKALQHFDGPRGGTSRHQSRSHQAFCPWRRSQGSSWLQLFAKLCMSFGKVSEAVEINETCGSVACAGPLATLPVCCQAFQILLVGSISGIHRVCPSLVHPLESRLECYWAGGVAVRLISIAA